MNVASRVKGLCKLYKVGIIFTENCIVDDSDFFVSRELDVVRVMGKSEPTKIFQLVGLQEHTDEGIVGMLNSYTTALKSFRQGKFSSAMNDMSEHLHDEPTRQLYDRAEVALQKFGDMSPSWNGGIRDLKTK